MDKIIIFILIESYCYSSCLQIDIKIERKVKVHKKIFLSIKIND